MADIMRVRGTSSGYSGGPGVSTFYFGVAVPPLNDTAAALACTRVKDAYTAAALLWPNIWSIDIDAEVEVIDEETGQLQGVLEGTHYVVTGGNSNSYEAPRAVGLLTKYSTGGFVNGKRVRGRTFHVPVSYYAFDTNGTPTSASLALCQDFGDSMLDAGTTDCVFGIWARPFAGKPGIAARSGSFHGATGASTIDEGVVLRSRRD